MNQEKPINKERYSDESQELSDGRREKISELIVKVDNWIAIGKSRIKAHFEIYGSNWIEETGQEIHRLGTEAPNNMVENYDFQRYVLRSNTEMIRILEDIGTLLKKGQLVYAWGESLEKKIDYLIENN